MRGALWRRGGRRGRAALLQVVCDQGELDGGMVGGMLALSGKAVSKGLRLEVSLAGCAKGRT